MIEDDDVRRERLGAIDELRAERESLREEEQRVSYWRQLVQGRLDLVRSAMTGGRPSPDRLPDLATRERGGASRSPAAADVGGAAMASPLAGLDHLWNTTIAWDDPEDLARHDRQLSDAEARLSAYRHALHDRIDDCTARLVDHYQRDPARLSELAPADPPR